MKLLDHLQNHAHARPNAIAYQEAGDGTRLTYRQLLDRATAAANRIARDSPPGSVVILSHTNQIELPIAILGTWLAGSIAFPLSADSTETEITAAAKDSGAALVFQRGEFVKVERGSELQNMPEETRLLLKSSGTTGRPQIVCRSTESIDAVCDQMVKALSITADDRVLAVAPLSHSYGIEHGLLMPLTIGAAVILCPGFDLTTVMRELDRSAITFLPGVPAMYEMLTRLAHAGQHWPHLRQAYSAGASLPRAVFDRARELFDLQIGQLYGATEIGSVTFNDPQSVGFDPASVGLPMNGVDAMIMGDENQLFVRARSMFSGYLDPTIIPRMRDGFFATGDIGSIDNAGRITIAGRLSLLIDVGGLKVNPIEVEEVIAQHEQVASCVVVPVRQSQTVCRIKAVVTPVDPDHPPAIESLRQFARQRLASHKLPRIFEVRETLPRTVTGKILRHLVDA
ncbi:MAG: acyl--CoA ligase [Phycisphaerae bacterium]|nr:acyl--CoA ligase [Phycisphaerae bacterium]